MLIIVVTQLYVQYMTNNRILNIFSLDILNVLVYLDKMAFYDFINKFFFSFRTI